MSENQYLRWGIPGWIFIIVIVSYWVVTPDFNLDIITKINFVGPVAFIVGAGIPLGFGLYQIYFGVDWWFKKNKLAESILEGVKNGPDLTLPPLSQCGYGKFMKSQRKNLPLVENAWHDKLFDIENDSLRESIQNRHNSLLLILHSLRVTVGAIIFGIFSSLTVFKLVRGYIVSNWVIISMITCFWLIAVITCYLNQKYVQYNIISFQNFIFKRNFRTEKK